MTRFVPTACATLLLLAAACTTQVGPSDMQGTPAADASLPQVDSDPTADALPRFEGPCGEGDASFESGGICYEYFFETASWADARLQCQFLSGDLARIDDSVANAILTSLVPSAFPNAWLLGSDANSEGSWTWDGQSMSYANWRSGEPDNSNGNENCMIIMSDQGGTWDDRNCTEQLSYVCQR